MLAIDEAAMTEVRAAIAGLSTRCAAVPVGGSLELRPPGSWSAT